MDDEIDGPMTDAELRVVREFLGLTGDWMAEHLGVQGRSWRRWESGTVPIPTGVRVRIEQLELVAAETVEQAVTALNDTAEDPAVITYRTDDAYRAAHPEAPFPASYHRAIVARIAQEVPGLVIQYSDDQADSP